tara:strand:+ start:153 stop:845 length:693 start_codon:yes stop_codon:yes gene_type:complete
VHYTHQEALLKILDNGFAWVPNARLLIKDLVPEQGRFIREPQEFGMISFSSVKPHKSSAHREKFGNYGIVMKQEWHAQNCTHKVFYLKNSGFVFSCFKFLFSFAYKNLLQNVRYEDDAFYGMGYENKNIAGVIGANEWVKALSIYEYLEPYENKNEKEWRVVNPMPLYGFADSKEEIIKNIDPPQNWAQFLHMLKFNAEDVSAFVCPEPEIENLKLCLPPHYKNKEIIGY